MNQNFVIKSIQLKKEKSNYIKLIAQLLSNYNIGKKSISTHSIIILIRNLEKQK